MATKAGGVHGEGGGDRGEVKPEEDCYIKSVSA